MNVLSGSSTTKIAAKARATTTGSTVADDTWHVGDRGPVRPPAV
jgi:hypothetical protein